MSRCIAMLVAACALASGCSGLTLDGRDFEVASCSSGQIWGFVGVDLTDREGRRIFVARTVEQRAVVTVYEAPTSSVDLGPCGDIDVDVDEVANEPYFVSGSFSIECAANGHSVKGRYRFSRCR